MNTGKKNIEFWCSILAHSSNDKKLIKCHNKFAAVKLGFVFLFKNTQNLKVNEK